MGDGFGRGRRFEKLGVELTLLTLLPSLGESERGELGVDFLRGFSGRIHVGLCAINRGTVNLEPQRARRTRREFD